MIEEAIHVITDPAHLLAEFVFIVVEAVVIGMIAKPLIKRWIKRHDETHHEPHTDTEHEDPEVEGHRKPEFHHYHLEPHHHASPPHLNNLAESLVTFGHSHRIADLHKHSNHIAIRSRADVQEVQHEWEWTFGGRGVPDA